MTLQTSLQAIRGAIAYTNSLAQDIANSQTTGYRASLPNQTNILLNNTFQPKNFSPSTINYSGRQLDLALKDDGFFLVQNQKGNNLLTRNGQFFIDKANYIVDSQGAKLLDTNSEVIQIKPQTLSPSATNNIDFDINLDSTNVILNTPFNKNDSSSFNYKTSTTIYDSLGQATQVDSYFTRTSATDYSVNIYADNQLITNGHIQFFANGTTANSPQLTNISYNPNNGAEILNLNFDFTDVTSQAHPNRIVSISQDGFSSGELTHLDINSDATITAFYDNGQKQIITHLAVVAVADPNELQAIGNQYFLATNQSGAPVLNSEATIFTGGLEESNVDLISSLIALRQTLQFAKANMMSLQVESKLLTEFIESEK